MELAEEHLQEQTLAIWSTLHRTFPDVDFRMQRDEGSTTLQILIQDSENALEHFLNVELEESSSAVFEAIFSVKALLQHFDA